MDQNDNFFFPLAYSIERVRCNIPQTSNIKDYAYTIVYLNQVKQYVFKTQEDMLMFHE